MQACLSQYLNLFQRAQENARIYFVNLSHCWGMFLMSLFGPCYKWNLWMLVVACFRDVNAVFQGRQSGGPSEGWYLPPRRFEMVQYCVVPQKSCYIWMSEEFYCHVIHRWIDWIVQHCVFLKDCRNWNFMWDWQLSFENMSWHVSNCCPGPIYWWKKQVMSEAWKKKTKTKATKTNKHPITFLYLKSLLFKLAMCILGTRPEICELGVGSTTADILLCASSRILSVSIWQTSF